MYLQKLELTNYRNYEKINNDFSSQINIFCGLNAQGKTNLLEAIYYLSTGKSYRPVRDMQLVKWNNSTFCIRGEVKNKYGLVGLEVLYDNRRENSKEVRVNGVKISKITELLGHLTSVLFAPEDLAIIKGKPGERRKILDNSILQVNPGCYREFQQYTRLLNQRNHFLKNMYPRYKGSDELEIWNQQFIDVGAEIIKKRLQVLEKLTPLTRLMNRRLTNYQDNLEIKYVFNKKTEIKKGDNIRNKLLDEMEQYRSEEIKRGMTLWGPHRDDILIVLNGNDLKFYGSQGQHRTAVLAVKLAEVEFIKAETGEFPVLLLDDVLSELDQHRREYLLDTILSKEIQCFITTTEENLSFNFNNKKTAVRRFYINNGKIL